MNKKLMLGTLLCAFVLAMLNASCTTDNKKHFTVNGVTFTMISVEGGTYTMGANEGEGVEKDESPEHSVTVDDFAIGETEVTQELWTAVMGKNPSGYTTNVQLPVESVNWFECQAFIEKLNELTGEKFRMPTEAEWEFAARGGNKSKGYLYSGSDSIAEVAWYQDNADNVTHPVKEKKPNELGLYDMSGNVWEWCSDWYADYSPEAATNPTGPQNGNCRVVRGGSWLVDPAICRSTDRSFGAPKGGGCILGLRLAM